MEEGKGTCSRRRVKRTRDSNKVRASIGEQKKSYLKNFDDKEEIGRKYEKISIEIKMYSEFI